MFSFWGWVGRTALAYSGVRVAVMSDTLRAATAPSEMCEAADWLRSRHPWVDQLARRITGLTEAGHDGAWGDWLDELAGAVTDCADHAVAWREYEARCREPAGEGAYVAWLDAGPGNTARGSAFAVMSGEEQRLVRLVATLSPTSRVAWSVCDVAFDERGAAVLQDWAADRARPAAGLAVPDLDRRVGSF